jgi:hypothetical protein
MRNQALKRRGDIRPRWTASVLIDQLPLPRQAATRIEPMLELEMPLGL